MPAKDLDKDVLATEPVESANEVNEPSRFHVDLPQFVQTETQRPTVKPLRPVADREPPRGLRATLKAAAKDWRLKGTVQKVLGVVPGGHTIHQQLQRRIGGLKNFAHECDVKVDDWRLMMEHLANAKMPVQHASMLEMGSGWYPTFPVCLYLAGAQQILTLDLNRLMDPALTVAMVERLGQHLALIARVARRPEDEVRASHAKLLAALREGKSIGAATNLTIDYRAPSDASSTSLPPAMVDVVFSNSVLEHVPPPVIDACFAEAMRILRPGGIVFHSVNCGDHYAYTDPTINQLHYLAYSDEAWQFWNNEFLYQNRLRAQDFTERAQKAGFVIELDTSRPHPDRLAQLEAIQVHERFAGYSRAQLAITSIDFIGRKPGAEERGN